MATIIPVTELKNTAKINDLCNTSNEPIFITKNGYGEMVIMSMKVYEEKMIQQDIYQKLSIAEDQVADGQLVNGYESLQKIKAKHGL